MERQITILSCIQEFETKKIAIMGTLLSIKTDRRMKTNATRI